MPGLPRGYAFKRELELTPREAAGMLKEGRLLLIDCRTMPEYEYAHVPGSVHIPLDELERRRDEIEPAEGQAVAVLCHHGVRSMKGTLALRALGVAGCRSVAGGIDSWSLGADAAVKRYERAGGVISSI